jgi:methyltransferase (TIGR00027 family)
VTTERIEAVFLTTHNWGKAAKFFQTLGFTLDFETDDNSGNDKIGLALLAPDQDWRRRGDMDPQLSRPFRASIVALALHRGPGRGRGQPRKYVILGAGLDSFAQRKPDIASHLMMFEIDQPGPQAWKRQRLIELGFGVPGRLRFVPVDFEAGESRRDVLVSAGCDAGKPAIMVSTGVSIYLTRDANTATLREVAGFAQGSTLAMTFLLPLETADDEVRAGLEMAERGARASGTPFVSFFTPPEMLALARDAGFAEARHVPAVDLTQRYFAGRTDGLRPPRNAEELLVART